MKSLRVALLICAALLFVPSYASAQGTEHFNKDGLLFDHPTDWELRDGSNADAQQINLGRGDSDAMIRIFVYRNHLSTPERIAEAKKVLVDSYVNSTAKQFDQMGARAQQAPASTEISGVKADGVKIQATLDEPGAAEVYWTVLEQRLVVLTFFGPDKARTKAMPAWDTVRNSLKVEAAKPSEKAAKPRP